MSAVSISHSPRWISNSPRRKPPATTTVAAAQLAPPNHVQTSAAVTSSKPAVPNLDDDTGNGADGGSAEKTNACGSRISFAPGTSFHDRTRLRSRGASTKVPPKFHFKQITPGEMPQTPKLRFKLPKATLPSLHYLSVSQEDFMDPRYAQDIVKNYGIPKYFFKSKSNLLVSPSKPLLQQYSAEGGAVVQTDLGAPSSENEKQKLTNVTAPAGGKEVPDDVRPKTSGETSGAVPRFSNRFQVLHVAKQDADLRSRSAHLSARGLGAGGDEGSQTGVLAVTPVYKPLIGEKYTQPRFFPPMNPYRSLQLESEVTKYVDHKKRVGLGRYVQFTEAEPLPTSAVLREATMYDLNHEGPAERPLDQFLPPPDRKPFIRQRPRDPKHDFVRSQDDRSLVIMSRERNSTEKRDVVRQ
ncbi:uncharacterized protein LOC143287355 [Babylonia areolata]|uniref:uncharacterized protein LOC143287355 n=1 Tax=Babylonia areolata TaxID=304850 RepID=UPI003FD57393